MSDSAQQMGAGTRVRSRWFIRIRHFSILALILALVVPAASGVASAQATSKSWYEVRTIYTEEHGLSDPQGLAFSPDANAFLLWQSDGSVKGITMYEESIDLQGLKTPDADVRNIAFNGHTKQLLALGRDHKQLGEIAIGTNGLPVPGKGSSQSQQPQAANLQAARGITFDPATGRMFTLNANGTQLVITSAPGAGLGSEPKTSIISLKTLTPGGLQGIAFNPQDGHLYLSDQTNHKLYELTQEGEKVAEYELSSLQLASPKSLVFAPSADRTDDPSNMNLFLLDGGQPESGRGQVLELALRAAEPIPSGVPILPASLVRVQDINNTAWNPSSPDPSGIDYWPQQNRLVITDSEVDEMRTYWQGANVFTASTSGTLLSTCSTMAYNNEPTGIAINPNTNRFYISSDRNNGLYFEIYLGPDGAYCTSDDVVSQYELDTDLEDVAYGNNTLFFAGGVDAEIYYFSLGANQVVGGGDDGPVQHFDTNAWGFTDAEGLGFHSGAGTILIHGSMGNRDYVAEVSQTGALLRAYDVSFMGDGERLHSDITYAPSSSNPAVRNIYIVSRGEDNNSNPRENDGKWWEISIGSNPGTPTVQVRINGSSVPGSPFSVASGNSRRESFDGIDAGPVQLIGTVPIVASERVLYRVNGVYTSYSEIMALPNNQLDNVYWLPWYNSVGLDNQLNLVNVSASTATIHVTIGGAPVTGSPFILQPGNSLVRSFPGIDNGPVRIQSNVNIVASQRMIYRVNGVNTSYTELLALPEASLNTTYWLPWYNNVGLDSQLRFANVSTSTATVHVTIGGAPVPGSPFTLPPGESTKVSFPGVDDGPVKIQSNVNIVASERIIYRVNGIPTSYSELMALPNSQLSTTYWLPWYNNVGLDSQLRFANVSGSTATIHVTVGGTPVAGSPFTLQPGTSLRQDFPGVDDGPVKIQSNVNIVASERVIYRVNNVNTSYAELMGLPNSLLDSTHWLPWYDNVHLDSQLRFGVP